MDIKRILKYIKIFKNILIILAIIKIGNL